MPEPRFKLVPDSSWSEPHVDPRRIDLNVRVAASLIAAGDFEHLYRRTGVRLNSDGSLLQPWMPVFFGLGHDWKLALKGLAMASKESNGYTARIPGAYREAIVHSHDRVVITGRVEWAQPKERTPASIAAVFRRAVRGCLATKGVRQVSLPGALQPTLEESLPDLAMPADRKVNGRKLDGAGVVIGIIDDGCALAHRHFLVPGTNKSRILYLWDQGRTSQGNGWMPPTNPPGPPQNPPLTPLYEGMEISRQAIDAILLACTKTNGLIDEDLVYERLKYELDIASHGTHVMDIAAGNGESLMGRPGVAPAADIIFVQLPRDLVDEGGPLLEDRIQEAVGYIFKRAAATPGADGKPRPVVVNISYGGYSGPHDGSSDLPVGIDNLLEGFTDRAVVISAGNGFEADCHAQGRIPVNGSHSLNWNLAPVDATANQLEIWYSKEAQLLMTLTPPLEQPLPPVKLGSDMTIYRSDNTIVGWIYHVPTSAKGHPNGIRILLNATAGEDDSPLVAGNVQQVQQNQPPATPAPTAPAPSGTWVVQLQHSAGPAATFHAWIARDDVRQRTRRRRQQSRFDEQHADPRSTIADIATGKFTISVGAHNAVTGETCRYSACGPTRDGRPAPHVTAPAEETATGGGILCASSRRAQPSRFNGTSASAPHVAGLAALVMQYNRLGNGPPLSPDRIRAAITKGATSGTNTPPPPAIKKVVPNRHEAVDAHRLPGKKQADHFADVKGQGKANVPESMNGLP